MLLKCGVPCQPEHKPDRKAPVCRPVAGTRYRLTLISNTGKVDWRGKTDKVDWSENTGKVDWSGNTGKIN